MLPPEQREQAEWAPTRAIWLPILQHERGTEMGQLNFNVISPNPSNFNEIGGLKNANFGADLLGGPVWEPGPNLEGGPSGIRKTAQPMPLPTRNLAATVEMLLEPCVSGGFGR
jgi:hypothetical protein